MIIFYICRHGETENNKNNRFSGWIDTPLTTEGLTHAASSAAKLQGIQLDKIVSSDLGRAFTTAYLISRELRYTSLIERFKGLREVNYGDFSNLPHTTYPELSALENADYIPPHGESLAQMQKRVLSCLTEIHVNNEAKTVLIVAHDGTINAIRSSFTGENIGVTDTTHNAYDFVAKFDFEHGQVTSFNDV